MLAFSLILLNATKPLTAIKDVLDCLSRKYIKCRPLPLREQYTLTILFVKYVCFLTYLRTYLLLLHCHVQTSVYMYYYFTVMYRPPYICTINSMPYTDLRTYILLLHCHVQTSVHMYCYFTAMYRPPYICIITSLPCSDLRTYVLLLHCHVHTSINVY